MTTLMLSILAVWFVAIFLGPPLWLAMSLAGWAFLTGTPVEILQVARQYGVYVKKTPRGDVDHTFLTSLIDRSGILRVQYLGVRFDPDELLRDLQSLMREETRQ